MVHYAGSRHLWTPLVNLGEICGRTEFIFVQHRHISSRDIQYYADKVRFFFCWQVQSLTKASGHVWKVHAAKGNLLVDSTFGPPPLQYPFKWGADCVMHSGEQEWNLNATQSVESGTLAGTKYFGGHSDLLCGVLVVKSFEEWSKVWIPIGGQRSWDWSLLRSCGAIVRS